MDGFEEDPHLHFSYLTPQEAPLQVLLLFHFLSSSKASSKMTANGCGRVQIPLIDLSGDEEHVGNELLEAVMKWGFVYIHGEALGFSSQVIEDTFDLVATDARPYIT